MLRVWAVVPPIVSFDVVSMVIPSPLLPMADGAGGVGPDVVALDQVAVAALDLDAVVSELVDDQPLDRDVAGVRARARRCRRRPGCR